MSLLALLGLGAVASAGGVALWQRTAEIRAWRSLRGRSPSTIADLVEGRPIKLVGRAHAPAEPAPLTAPLTGRPCIAYTATLIGAGARRADQLRASLHIRLASSRSLHLVDDTGAATVELTTARLLLVRRSMRYNEVPIPPQLLEQIARAHGQTALEPSHWEESILCEDDEIVVGGTAMRDLVRDADAHTALGERAGAAIGISTERGYRDAPSTTWAIRGSAKQPVLICDEPRGF